MSEKTIQEKVDQYRDKVDGRLQGFPEAGAICYATVYVNGIPINLTQRANNVYDAYAAFKMGVDLLGEVFGIAISKDIPQAAPPKPTPVSDKFEQDFPEPVYEDIDGVESSFVNSIKILPQPDNKVTIEFLKDGMKYPVAKINKWPLDRAQGFLAKVTTQDVSKPAEVKVECTVYWKQGKEFAPGKFYKDILKAE